MAFKLKSTAFENEGNIPEKFTRYGSDVSPELTWNEPPPNTKSFALIADDFHAPIGAEVHWMVWNIDGGIRRLNEGVAQVQKLPDGTQQGENDFGVFGYSGPRQLHAAPHHLTFSLYALDFKLVLPAEIDRRGLKDEMLNHILGEAKLVGVFQPSRLQARTLTLEIDKEYVAETDRLQKQLEAAYQHDPTVVTAFFRKFSLALTFAQDNVEEFLRDVSNSTLRRLLEDYVKYANRFRVRFRLNTNSLQFEPIISAPDDDMFHVRVVGDHFEPARRSGHSGNRNDPFADFFGSDDLAVSKEMKELIDAGKARFVQIEDGPGYSLLKDLESFAYKDDGVTFFLHKAEQPYLGCIFGEKMSKQLLHDMGKTITKFQHDTFERTSGGRPPDIARLKKMQDADRKPISNKEKAAELAEDGDLKKIKRQEVALSQHRAKKRKKKR